MTRDEAWCDNCFTCPTGRGNAFVDKPLMEASKAWRERVTRKTCRASAASPTPESTALVTAHQIPASPAHR